MSRAIVLALLLIRILRPGAAAAQQNGSIAGIVTDTTGSLLPGVTVEVSSPASSSRAAAPSPTAGASTASSICARACTT